MKRLLFLIICLASTPVLAEPEPYPGPYSAEVIRVVDGDTILARVAVWPDVAVTTYIRLADIDAPELGEVGGLEAKAFLEQLVSGQPLTLHFPRPGKYARRMIATVRLGDGRDVAGVLLDAGYAEVFSGP